MAEQQSGGRELEVVGSCGKQVALHQQPPAASRSSSLQMESFCEPQLAAAVCCGGADDDNDGSVGGGDVPLEPLLATDKGQLTHLSASSLLSQKTHSSSLGSRQSDASIASGDLQPQIAGAAAAPAQCERAGARDQQQRGHFQHSTGSDPTSSSSSASSTASSSSSSSSSSCVSSCASAAVQLVEPTEGELAPIEVVRYVAAVEEAADALAGAEQRVEAAAATATLVAVASEANDYIDAAQMVAVVDDELELEPQQQQQQHFGHCAQAALGAAELADLDEANGEAGTAPTTSSVSLGDVRADAWLAREAQEQAAREPLAAAAFESGSGGAVCRLERSNSCSQAEGAAAVAAAAAASSLTTVVGANGSCLASACMEAAVPSSASLSHDNLATSCGDTDSLQTTAAAAAAPTKLTGDADLRAYISSAPIDSLPTAGAGNDLRQVNPLLVADEANAQVYKQPQQQPQQRLEKQAQKQQLQQQQQQQQQQSSSRFFSSKLNTGSLWSLLSVGSATSTSALNELMPSPEPAGRQQEAGGQQRQQQQADKMQQADQSAGSSMANFFTRQLQFAKRPQPQQQHSGASSASSASLEQQQQQQQQQQQSATRGPMGGQPVGQGQGDKRPEARNHKYRFNVKYVGSAMLHKNFTLAMLEWIVKDIRRQTNRALNQRQFTIPIRDVVFEIAAGQLTAISAKDGHCIFVHPMHCVSKYAQLQHDPTCFAYIIRDNKDSPSFCHSFQAKSAERVHAIFNAIRETTTRNQLLAPLPQRQPPSKAAPDQQQQLPTSGSGQRLQKSASTDGHWRSLLTPTTAGGGSGLQAQQMSKTPPIAGQPPPQQQQHLQLQQSASCQQFPSIHSQPRRRQQQPEVAQPMTAAAAAASLAPAAAAAAAAAQFENSYQFEVMFVKRVKLQCRRVPPSFVDDALATLKSFEPPKAQLKGVNKRIISASVDERQEYDEGCQSPTPGACGKSGGGGGGGESDERRRGSDGQQQQRPQLQPVAEAGGRESRSCQQSPTKLTAPAAATATDPPTEGAEQQLQQQQQQQQLQKLNRSVDCLRDIGCTIKSARSKQAPAYFNDFSPYNTITSSDLNERIAAIPVVSSSVSLDHETRQQLARQVRETIMATAATIKKDVCASGDQLDRSSGSSKLLDSLSCNAHSSLPPVDHESLLALALADDEPDGSGGQPDKYELEGRARLTTNATTASAGSSPECQRQRSSAVRQSQSAAALVGNNFDLFRRTSGRQVVKNRTMLLLIGKDELCAISIDKHQVLFSKTFNAIVHCLQGMSNRDHFGLICRDSAKINPQAECYAGFLFKCQSEKVVREIMGALKQVIYSSQHNYHGLNSPYNPLNYSQQQQQHQQQQSAKAAELDKAKGADRQMAPPSSAPLSLAAKRGFISRPIEINDAAALQAGAGGELSPATAPAPALAPKTINPIKSMFCDDCPLYWFHRLCCDIESLPAEASKAIILRRIDASLTDREQDEVYSKFSEFNIESVDEHNELFMSILRQLNERKQLKHNASQAHANAMAKSLRLAKQQSSELLKHQQQQQQPPPPTTTTQDAQSGATNFAARTAATSAGSGHHQRSGSSGGSLAAVGMLVGQAGAMGANQSALVDASSAAIDNLKRAKNSISVSIENMLKRRSSLRDADQAGAGESLMERANAGALGLLSRAGSFKGAAGASSHNQAAGGQQQQRQQQQSEANLKRSQSTSDYQKAAATTTTTRDARPLNEAIRHDEPRRTSNDSLAGQQRSGSSSRHLSPTRPHEQPQQQTASLSARWMQPAGNASPSSYLSGSFWKKSIFDKIHQAAGGQEAPAPAEPEARAVGHRSATPDEPATEAAAAAAARRTRAELRSLWRKAILEQITLLKMDKQNQKLQANYSVECNIQRLKLNYRDVPFAREASALWDKLLKRDPTKKVQFFEVAKLVRLGVPKQRRGEIWMFLMNQYQLRHGTSFQPPPDSEFKGDADQTYRSLLSQLSTQQHEIFVDIGRTFPAHPYYSQYLSIGQLSLFNLLKAYSLLDKEVGYCQGLSFVAGLLLLHVDSEDEAFELMRHLLFNFGLRKQYLPSMNALHLQLYQLTRLLRDHQYAIFEQFDRYDISPSLYAAPWFLTLFASQFPLGFVSRLLDLIYLIGIEAIFRVSLTLLAYHRDSLLACTSLEGTIDFMRTELVKIDDKNLTKIFDDAIALDLRNKLIEYEIEYSFYCAEDKARAGSHQQHPQQLPQHYLRHSHQHALANSARQSANSSSSTVYSDVRSKEGQNLLLEDEQLVSTDSSDLTNATTKTTTTTTTTMTTGVGQDEAEDQADHLGKESNGGNNSTNGNNSTSLGLTSEVADATATVIIQHLLANNHLRSLRSNYSY